jgi:hypothetical protein
MGQKSESREGRDKVSEVKKKYFTTKTPRHKGISAKPKDARKRRNESCHQGAKTPRLDLGGKKRKQH